MGIRGNPLYPRTTLHSLGGIYAGASMYALSGMDDPGKLMGLAPYGRAGLYDFEIFDLREGRAFVNYDWMKEFRRPTRSYEEFKANFQYYADFAYWVQREIERALLNVINHRYEIAPSDNLAYSGGVALNAVANRRILRETKFRDIYMQPLPVTTDWRSVARITVGWRSCRRNGCGTMDQRSSARSTRHRPS
jgi:carbamoyltransferase